MMKRRHLLLALVAVGLRAVAAAAQASDSLGSVVGEVHDSVHARRFAGAVVMITPSPPGAEGRIYHGEADRKGRFRVDVPAGVYQVTLAHAWLDSVGIVVPPTRVTVRARTHTRVKLGVPSSYTLRRAVCGEALQDSTLGVIAGVVQSAETGQPVAGARAVFRWTEIHLDRATRRVASDERIGSVLTDSSGIFRACGLPMATLIVMQAQVGDERNSGVLDVHIGVEGVTVTTLLVSERPVSAAPSVDSVAGAVRPMPADSSRRVVADDTAGTFVIVGRMTGPDGQPIANAQIRLLGTNRASASNATGRYRLTGVPAGTQGLEFAALGYYPTRRRIDVRPGAIPSVDVSLSKLAAVMDTIRVLAMRGAGNRRLASFEERRMRGMGRFLTDEQIRTRSAFFTSDLFYTIPGVRVVGGGPQARLVGSRGSSSCLTLYLDGMRIRDDEVNTVSPNVLYGIEVYSTMSGPAEYPPRGCTTVVLLWSK